MSASDCHEDKFILCMTVYIICTICYMYHLLGTYHIVLVVFKLKMIRFFTINWASDSYIHKGLHS